MHKRPGHPHTWLTAGPGMLEEVSTVNILVVLCGSPEILCQEADSLLRTVPACHTDAGERILEILAKRMHTSVL